MVSNVLEVDQEELIDLLKTYKKKYAGDPHGDGRRARAAIDRGAAREMAFRDPTGMGHERRGSRRLRERVPARRDVGCTDAARRGVLRADRHRARWDRDARDDVRHAAAPARIVDLAFCDQQVGSKRPRDDLSALTTRGLEAITK